VASLEEFFETYRASCPDIEPSPNFMPSLWQKIEARHNFWFIFQGLARSVSAACAALCLVLLALNLLSSPQPLPAAPSYTEALMEDHSAEKTDYAETIRNAPGSEDGAVNVQR
jgi:hypothetical protein